MIINWQQVLLHLRARYKPLAQVAKEIGSSEKHLNGIARGEVNEPKFNTGMKLLDMHLDKCPDLHRPNRILCQ